MKFISGDELAEIIKGDGEAKKDYLVVDVRDEDFEGGNIKNAANWPSKQLSTTVDELVNDAKDVPLLIFHCTLSQMRGPTAARKYVQSRVKSLEEGEGNPNQEVVVLQDGFSLFQSKFKDDPELVENWDEKVWASN